VSGTRDEIEVKARVDDPGALTRVLLAAGARVVFDGEMIDRRFDRRRTLEGRDEVLRLRIYRPANGGAPWGELGWKGPKRERGGYRHRAEWETRVADHEAAGAILERLGYEVSLRIDRRITQLELGRAVIRIEWYPEMDVLVEVEGGPDDIERAIGATGLPRDAFLAKSLPHFMRAYERRTGRRARLAADPA
jgi:adenylate cyclase class IV